MQKRNNTLYPDPPPGTFGENLMTNNPDKKLISPLFPDPSKVQRNAARGVKGRR
jgi:hypothetical protein